MNLIGYLRVSTDRQVEEGQGLLVQRESILEWATDQGHEVTHWVADEGISGKSGLEHRVGLAEALTGLSEGLYEGIVVYRLDRLARDLVLQEQLLADVRRLGGQMFTTSSAEADFLVDDPDDPSRRLIRQVLGAVSEYERAMISLRLKAGRQQKSRSGGYAYGAPPLGYRADKGSLVPEASEQAAVARAYELRSDGGSFRAIAAQLTREGFRTKRSDGSWHPETVRRVVARERSTGETLASPHPA